MVDVVKDAIGVPASVGDKVVFAPGQRGAQKMRRLSQWCQDATFTGLVNAFREYQDQKQEA